MTTRHMHGRAERGMTLLEMMISLLVFSIVTGTAFAYLRSQGRGFLLGSDRAATLQNLRYAANILELDLRALGGNVPDGQPFVIYAGPDVIAFNTDYATNIAGDPFAIYYDPDAPNSTVTAMQKSQKITLPQTSFAYPDTNYTAQGNSTQNSPAETITFFFSPDSSTSRSDDYVLFKKINNLKAEAVARNLVKTGSQPFFKYFWEKTPVSQPKYIQEVPAASLPLKHAVAIHGAPNDSGPVSRVDSVRGMELNLSATNGKAGSEERKFSITRVIRFPNAGLSVKRTCGDEPLLGTALIARDSVQGVGDVSAFMSWSPATDESGGEKDVTRYVVWRREIGGAWGNPFLSVPAGQAAYSYLDETVESGKAYQFALAAQDCTPSMSQLAISAAVVIP